jgi:hypothetical protein
MAVPHASELAIDPSDTTAEYDLLKTRGEVLTDLFVAHAATGCPEQSCTWKL